ncbi:MAG: type II toxin-antitoxin system VapC family toxin [Thiomonas sp.]
MIVLDTNVVSEPLKPNPDPAVLIWLDNQEPQTLYLTAINLAELFAGIEALPAGRRKTQLHQAIKQQLLPLFSGRILSFDQQATENFARINAKTQAEGAPIGFADCAIAAIAATHGFLLATRNVRDFQHAGIALLNPWAEKD